MTIPKNQEAHQKMR